MHGNMHVQFGGRSELKKNLKTQNTFEKGATKKGVGRVWNVICSRRGFSSTLLVFVDAAGFRRRCFRSLAVDYVNGWGVIRQDTQV